MQQVTLTLTNVFDVVRKARKGPYTRFGFSSDGQTHVGLTVEGHPRIESGMKITAILRKDGDWNTLEGWLDHDTGACVMPMVPSPVTFVMMAIFATVLVVFGGQGHGGPLHVDPTAALYGLALGCVAIFASWQYLSKKRICAALTHLHTDLLHADPALAHDEPIDTEGERDPWNIDLTDAKIAAVTAVCVFTLEIVFKTTDLAMIMMIRNALILAVIAMGARKITQSIQSHRNRD
jgi:hypothetical protein